MNKKPTNVLRLIACVLLTNGFALACDRATCYAAAYEQYYNDTFACSDLSGGDEAAYEGCIYAADMALSAAELECDYNCE